MKQIGMITVHRTLNYGTMLQMYACSKLFKHYGYDTIIIDYYREHDYKEEDFKSVLSYCKKKQTLEKPLGLKRKLISIIKAYSTFEDTKKFYKICNNFINKNLELSNPYYSYYELKKNPPQMDVYCVGSDQVWNSDYNGNIDPTFFFGFINDSQKKIAFSSSIGKDSLTDSEKIEFQKMLVGFKAISVREKKAQELLQMCKIDSKFLLDPTLIINNEEWSTLCSKPVFSKPYLLVYKLKSDDRIDQVAYRIAKKKKISVVRVSFSKLKKKKGETTIVLPSISQFLSLIKNADYVVTNSFHGTCFSINFGRQFTSVPRENYNSRIMNVLSLLSLNSRYCTLEDAIDNQLERIDYDRVVQLLNQKRAESKLWLEYNLNE